MSTQNGTIEIIEEKIIKDVIVIQNDTQVSESTMLTIEDVTLSTTEIQNTESTTKAFYKAFTPTYSILNELPNISNTEDYLLSPSPFSINTSKYAISIGVSLTAKSTKPIKDLASLQFHCQPTLNSDGLPQLNIFIFYNDTDATEPTKQFYWENIFEINFPQDAIAGVTLSNIETVQVFQINGDPRTSRGTVTTVKQTDKN